MLLDSVNPKTFGPIIWGFLSLSVILIGKALCLYIIVGKKHLLTLNDMVALKTEFFYKNSHFLYQTELFFYAKTLGNLKQELLH